MLLVLEPLERRSNILRFVPSKAVARRCGLTVPAKVDRERRVAPFTEPGRVLRGLFARGAIAVQQQHGRCVRSSARPVSRREREPIGGHDPQIPTRCSHGRDLRLYRTYQARSKNPAYRQQANHHSEYGSRDAESPAARDHHRHEAVALGFVVLAPTRSHTIMPHYSMPAS